MNRSDRDLWTKALRSGKYKQCRKHLHVIEGGGTGYCCLGVYCDVMGVEFRESSDKTAIYDFNGIKDAGLLPDVFRDLQGITYDQQQSLIELNDENEASFEEIADWIEDNNL